MSVVEIRRLIWHHVELGSVNSVGIGDGGVCEGVGKASGSNRSRRVQQGGGVSKGATILSGVSSVVDIRRKRCQ